MVTVNIDLFRQGAGIRTDIQMIFDAPFIGEFSFLLSPKMNIECISSPQCEGLGFILSDAKEPFRKANRVSVVVPQAIAALQLSYNGEPEGWHTAINDVIFAINYYSAWYPDDINVGCRKLRVKFHDNFYTHMVHAHRNVCENVWEYTPNDSFDCNILAYKDAKLIDGDALALLYTGENDGVANTYFDAYNDVAQFCMNLFGADHISKNTLVILPNGNAQDGYCRKSLIVLGGFSTDISFSRHLLAHEVAHKWCIGADTHSWEDWLNETTAEWVALLYQLHIGDNATFASVIEEKQRRCKNHPIIKTADGSRPDGVHDKGVILFYDIYKKHGYDAIEKMLKLFNSLTEKCTDKYIQMIDDEIGSDIANMIRIGTASK